ncbi:putative subunit of mRNA cleavage and polyadenylation factor [Suhomyces tanzawaensis NRRL Y-17324]|uniref:Cleavage and polyadenylation specificity factor subunit 2 n=1 Tax=Suhomyces tanzawaensis NRRL Y-17324 TaxID=984487 RepID=A0A1E4SNJ6_9ASCO|nr:putative subunit of mRNA cleavage and polyadenylation factor [Suhomyces tanzawaensis NRRL Y-17324]ODV81058.1 putative subunit of mRNA cleavage and polyadenylation factor [Suhomyces tanzawaensis NRRL Y-17324]
MFTFTLISPKENDLSFKASYITFDGEFKILADPVWNGKDPDSVLFIEKYLREVQVILLSHSTPESLSGYILLCVKFPVLMSSISVYSTLPVNQLGRISTVEYYRTNGVLGPLSSSILELDDIDEWFDKVNIVKYLQTTTLLESKAVITPYNSGHTLGGTFWLITKRLDKVIYAPAWNHSRDLFLNNADFLSAATGAPIPSLLRPTAFITSSDVGSSMPHKRRVEKFLQLVDATLANGGSVLLPTTLSGRFFELFRLVDEHLQGAPIPIYFISYSGTKILSYASNLVDWMSSSLREWSGGGGDETNLPFDPSKVDLLGDPNELIKLSGPKIIFCSGNDLRNGELSSQVFQHLCQDEKTTILLTERSQFGVDNTLSSILYKEWYDLTKKKNGGKVEDGIAVPLERKVSISDWTREEPINGAELQAYQKRIHAERKEKLAAKVRDRKNQNLLNADGIDDDSSDDGISSEEEEEEEVQVEQGTTDGTTESKASSTKVTNLPANPVLDVTSHEAFLTDHIKKSLEQNKPLDIKITHKLKPRQAMFPYFVTSHKQKFDDYGEVIDLKDFEKTDEVSNSKIILEGKKKFEQNEKKKWGDDYDKNGRDRGKRGQGKNQNKLTPQEMLNNQLLQKNLDTLFNPKKRIPLQAGSSYSKSSQLSVRCGLSFVDLAGLVDMRSLSIIVSSLKPYNVLLLPDFTVYDQEDKELNGLLSVQSMFNQQQDDQKKDQTKKDLFTSSRYLSLTNIRSGISGTGAGVSIGPTKMNIVPVANNHAIKIGGDGGEEDEEDNGIGLSNFEAQLDEELVEELNWQNIDGSYRVVQVFGELELRNQNLENKKKRELSDYLSSSTLFTLKKIKKAEYLQKVREQTSDTAVSVAQTKTGPKLAIGNIRLPELKKKLLSRNLNAEFKGEGTLVVNDKLIIRKVAYSSAEGDDTGDIVIDGSMGPLYYIVKDCIREMLAYVY